MNPNRLQENPAVFNARFTRSRKLLYFVARRLLHCTHAASMGTHDAHIFSHRLAKDAVQKTWLTASQNPPTFPHEGAFRSWLIRILIDEALTLRRTNCKPIPPSSALASSTRFY